MNHHPFLVTGATDGIGFETALGILQAGHAVIVHGRTAEKARTAAGNLLRMVPGAQVRSVHGDFSHLDEVRDLGLRIHGEGMLLSGVVHNAGAYFPSRTMTPDGWEATWQVNHLAPFLLHHQVAPLLASGARVVWVSSMLHARGTIPWDHFNREAGYDGGAAYSASKLANALTAFRLARNHSRSSLSVFALHPGVVGTKMLKKGFGMDGISPADGARTSLFAALDPSLDKKTGLWLESRAVGQASAATRDEELQDRLWDWSLGALGL